MINQKYHRLAFVAVMALLMSIAMSFTMTAINAGFSENFLILWRNAFTAGYLVAFPLSFVISPAARSIVAMMIKE